MNESPPTLKIENFDKVCQICLKLQKESIPLNAQISNEATVGEMLQAIVSSVLYQTSEEYPQQICMDCLQKLIDAYTFQQKIVETRKAIVKVLDDHHQKNIKTEMKEQESESEDEEGAEDVPIQDEDDPETDTEMDQSIEESDAGDCQTETVKERLEDGGEVLEPIDKDDQIKFEPCSNLIKNTCFKGASKGSPKKIKLTKLKNVECGICSKVFADLRGLRTHYRSHTGERPYLCNFCSKTFADRNCLNVHIKRMHTAEGFKKHQCPYCPQKASDKTHLMQHIRTHTGEKPDICPICGKAFNGKCPLKKHILWHSEERPYACRFCPQKFKMKKILDVKKLLVYSF